MILPSKHLRPDRALLTVGAQALGLLSEPKTVSRLWDEFQRLRDLGDAHITYDWFILALDLLFITGVVDFRRGRLYRSLKG